MKSTAQIKGHPIHPILVAFPIALYTGTLVFDILGATNDTDFLRLAVYLEIGAIGTALMAAVPGIIDFSFTVPPNSSAKKRAAKHGLINVMVLLLFSASLVYRLRTWSPDPAIMITLEAIGFILLLFAGWMGGTLVYKNHIGMVPRYANSGKWKEEYLEPSNGYVEISAGDIGIDQMKLIHVKGKRIVITKTPEGYRAFDDHCTHKGGSLAGGAMICGTVQCPWHGSQFSVHNGSITAGPATQPIAVYSIEQQNDTLRLAVNW